MGSEKCPRSRSSPPVHPPSPRGHRARNRALACFERTHHAMHMFLCKQYCGRAGQDEQYDRSFWGHSKKSSGEHKETGCAPAVAAFTGKAFLNDEDARGRQALRKWQRGRTRDMRIRGCLRSQDRPGRSSVRAAGWPPAWVPWHSQRAQNRNAGAGPPTFRSRWHLPWPYVYLQQGSNPPLVLRSPPCDHRSHRSCGPTFTQPCPSGAPAWPERKVRWSEEKALDAWSAKIRSAHGKVRTG